MNPGIIAITITQLFALSIFATPTDPTDDLQLVHWYQTHAATELNRALAAVKLHFPHWELSEDATASQLASQLQEKGYLDAYFLLAPEHLPDFDTASSKFLAAETVSAEWSPEPGNLPTSNQVLERYYLLLFANDDKTSHDYSLKELLRSLIREENATNILLITDLILEKNYFKRPTPKIPRRLKTQIETLATLAKDPSQKARALYLNYTFLDAVPFYEMPVLVQSIQDSYPVDYLSHLLRKLPEETLLKFRKPLLEGYGNRFESLIRIFAKFQDREEIRECLLQCLILSRKNSQSHLAQHQGLLEKVWQGWTQEEIPENLEKLRHWKPTIMKQN